MALDHRRTSSLEEPVPRHNAQDWTTGEAWHSESGNTPRASSSVIADDGAVNAAESSTGLSHNLHWRHSIALRNSQLAELDGSVRRDHEISLGLFYTEAFEIARREGPILESGEESIASSFDESLWWEWTDRFIESLSDAACVSRDDVVNLAQRTTSAEDSILDTYFLMLMDEAQTRLDRSTAAFLHREWHRLGIKTDRHLQKAQAGVHLPGTFESREQQLQQLHAFLSRGTAWQWLSQQTGAAASSTYSPSPVREAITRAFRHRYENANDEGLHAAVFLVDWDPLRFVKEEFESVPQLEKIITITGGNENFQACTCADYVQQTWPQLRLDLIHMLQNSIGSAFEPNIAYQLGTEASIKLQLMANSDSKNSAASSEQSTMHLKVTVQGSYLLIVEVGEQLAWLGATCASSPWPDRACARVTECTLDDHGSGLNWPVFDIKYGIVDLLTDALSDCWRSLFRNPSIASGYPIKQRDSLISGMEMTLQLMVRLGDIIWAMEHNDHFMLKGFSSLFYPVRRLDGMTTWHFACKDDGIHIAYSAASSSACGREVMAANDLSWLHNDRHVIGWAHETTSTLGTKSAIYSAIDQPTQLASANFFKPSKLVLERATVNVGHCLTVGLSIAPARKDRGVFIADTPWLSRMVQNIKQQSVMLYDTNEKRAWLVDGASVLLHITCAQLEILQHTAGFEPGLRDKFKYCDSEGEVRSPSDCLLDPLNQEIILSSQVHRRVTKRTWNAKGKLVEKTVEEVSYWLLQELMQDNWRVLSQIIEHQNKPPVNGKEVRLTPRNRLEGWSFKSIVDAQSRLEPMLVYHKRSVRSWVDLVRSTHIPTLLGTGFGEILHPTENASACPHWTSVPEGQDYLATTLGTLRALAYQKGCIKQFPAHLTPTLGWHQPELLFGDCQRSLNQGAEHCYRLQTCIEVGSKLRMLIRSWSPPTFDDERTCPQDKAGIIFGSKLPTSTMEEPHGLDEGYNSLTPESSRESQHSQHAQPAEQDAHSNSSPISTMTADDLYAQQHFPHNSGLRQTPPSSPTSETMQTGADVEDDEDTESMRLSNYTTSWQQQTETGTGLSSRDHDVSAARRVQQEKSRLGTRQENVAFAPSRGLRRMPKSGRLRANSL